MAPDTLTSLDLAPAWAEIFVLTAACVVLLIDVFLNDRHRIVTYLASMVTLAGAAYITATHAMTDRVTTFHNMFVADPMGDVLKFVAYAAVGIVFLYSREYLQRRGLFK